MLVTAILVLILGLYAAWWGHRAERASHKLGTVIIASTLGWLLIATSVGAFILKGKLLLGIMILLGSCLFLHYIYGDERRAIKKILRLYLSIRREKKTDSEVDILRETGIRYYHDLKWDESRIQELIDGILDEKKEYQTTDIIDFTVWLLQFQLLTLENRWGSRYEMAVKILSRMK